MMFGMLGLGCLMGMYGKFARGFNIMWLPGSLLPFAGACVYNEARQNNVHIINCYSYILQKRIASVELQANSAEWERLPFVDTPEYLQLSESVRSRGITLYQLENQIVDLIETGKL